MTEPKDAYNKSFDYVGGHFALNHSGVTFVYDKKRGDEFELLEICSPLAVIAKTRDQKSGEWGRLLQWHDDDGKLHRLTVALSSLEGDGQEMRKELARGGLHIHQSRKAREMLATYIKLFPIDARVRCANRLGWHGDVYVTPQKTIGSSDESILYQGPDATACNWTVKADVDQWKTHIGNLVAGNSRLVFSVAVAFAAPLLYPSGELSGGFHLRGSSSSGKSTALKVAASVWSAPKDFVGTWRATSNGLEGIAVLRNDHLLVLDEIGQLDPQTAGDVAYMLANGKGKARSSKQGDAQAISEWRLLLLSAGEVSLSEVIAMANKKVTVGQEIRLADIEADAGQGMGIVEDLHGFASAAEYVGAVSVACDASYGAVGDEWLNALVANRERFEHQIKQDCARLTSLWVPAGASGQVTRVAKRFALVAVAGELASELGLTGWQPGESDIAAKRCFDAWLENYGGIGDQEDRKIVQQATEMLHTHGAGRFQNIRGDDYPRIHNRLGYYRDIPDEGREYLVPSEVFKSEFCRGLNLTRAIRALKARGMLIPGKGESTHSIRVPDHGNLRLYVLKLPTN